MGDLQASGAGKPLASESQGGGALALMVAGLGLFGLATGVTTGLSTQQGISTTLLTSLFSFAGGTILAYAGFARALQTTSSAVPDLSRVGAALCGFSLGVLLGTLAGIELRTSRSERLAEHVAARETTERLERLAAFAKEELELRRLASEIDQKYPNKDRSALAALTALSGPATTGTSLAKEVRRPVVGDWSLQSGDSPLCKVVADRLRQGVYIKEPPMAISDLTGLCTPTNTQ